VFEGIAKQMPWAVGVQGSGMLDDLLDQATFPAPERPPESAQDPRQDGRVETEQVADGYRELPDRA